MMRLARFLLAAPFAATADTLYLTAAVYDHVGDQFSLIARKLR